MKEQHSRVLIHVGTNDYAERDTTAEEMLDLCEKMVRGLKNETVEITISAVLPICHDDETTGRIASLNVGFLALAQDTASKFITHEDYIPSQAEMPMMAIYWMPEHICHVVDPNA